MATRNVSVHFKIFNFIVKLVQRNANNNGEIIKGRKRYKKHGNNIIFNEIERISFYYHCIYISIKSYVHAYYINFIKFETVILHHFYFSPSEAPHYEKKNYIVF